MVPTLARRGAPKASATFYGQIWYKMLITRHNPWEATMALAEMLTPEEVAEYLRVTPATVYASIRQGRLVAFRVGQQYRISRENLDLFLLSNATAQPPLRTFNEDDVERFLDEDHIDESIREIGQNLLRALRSKA